MVDILNTSVCNFVMMLCLYPYFITGKRLEPSSWNWIADEQWLWDHIIKLSRRKHLQWGVGRALMSLYYKTTNSFFQDLAPFRIIIIITDLYSESCFRTDPRRFDTKVERLQVELSGAEQGPARSASTLRRRQFAGRRTMAAGRR